MTAGPMTFSVIPPFQYSVLFAVKMCTCGIEPFGRTVTPKAITASEDEQQQNPRSRSARLRAWQKSE
jgi:16S rRNA C1402 N4-methylase RsmH